MSEGTTGGGVSQSVIAVVANNKGGVGKSLFSALAHEQLSLNNQPRWDLIEIEHKARHSQEDFSHAPGTKLTCITLVDGPDGEPSAAPLYMLHSFIPGKDAAARRLLVDCGGSAWQAIYRWGVGPREGELGFARFVREKFKFISFIPVQANDPEAVQFFNENVEVLSDFGPVVLVKNGHHGTNFRGLDAALVEKCLSVSIPQIGEVLQSEMSVPGDPTAAEEKDRNGKRFTFRQVAANPSSSRRARVDANRCVEQFSAEFQRVCRLLEL